MSIQDLFGITLPIIQAPMAGVQLSALAIAVSNAGGLGSLPCAMLGPEAIRRELEAIRRGTQHPVNINFFCHQQPAFDTRRETTWRTALAPYYLELNVDPAGIATGPGRLPFDNAAAEVLEAFKPSVVSFHFGLPTDALLARLRGWGAKVMSSATTVAEAIALEARGVDAIIAQGLEAGGHRGMFLSTRLDTQMGTLALVPQIVRAVRVPVIAAGGIADAQGVAAVLALGAIAAQIGTAYMLCPEAITSPMHRTALTSDAARDTALTNLFTGRPARGIMNRLMRELGPMSDAAPEFPLATGAIAPLRARAEVAGSADFSPLWAGQNASGCKAIPAALLTRELAGQTKH